MAGPTPEVAPPAVLAPAEAPEAVVDRGPAGRATAACWPLDETDRRRPGALPLGLQLIGRPGGEAMLMDYAAALERAGVTGFTAPERAHEGELA